MASEYGCYSSDDRTLAVAPLFHGAGFSFALAALFFGAYCEICPKFDAATVLSTLKTQEITSVFMVPTHFQAIFALSEQQLHDSKPEHLKTIISNASALPHALKMQVIEYFGGGILHETYGSTEAGVVCNLRPIDQLRKNRCVGLGYWGNPLTASSILDGWFSAGDLARVDDEGFVYIVDRKTDMIISGGVNIYPREIEEVLREHPGVSDVAVIGVPDSYWGESVKAFIVRADNSGVGDEDLKLHCRQTLAAHKLPKTFEYIPELPRGGTGKVLKRELA
jgi:long-chain acyl-CoA synthetase